MPLTRISLRKGRSKQYLQAISSSLHQALTETFDVPDDDCFQLFHQHEPEEMVFDTNYLSDPRNDEFIVFAVTAGKPRSAEIKQRFYNRLTELLVIEPGISPANVMVVISHNTMDDWSFGMGVVASGLRLKTPQSEATSPPLNQPGQKNPDQMMLYRKGKTVLCAPDGIANRPFDFEPILGSTVDGEMTAIRADLEAGTTTHWHSHPKGQLLYVLSGTGQAQTENSERVTLSPGDAIWFAPNERHWHGATSNGSFSYLSIQAVEHEQTVHWYEPVQFKESIK